MALAITEPTGDIASTTNTTAYSLASFTPTAGALLVLMVVTSDEDSNGSVGNTGTALTWNIIGPVDATDGNHSTRLFWAVVPASVSASVITYTGGAAATGCLLMLQQVTGQAVGSNPIKQVTSSAGNSASPGVVFPAALDTNNAYILGGGAQGIVSLTDPTGWTRTAASFYITPSTAGAMLYRVNGETGTSINYSYSGSARWTIIAMEVYANQNIVVKMVQHSEW